MRRRSPCNNRRQLPTAAGSLLLVDPPSVSLSVLMIAVGPVLQSHIEHRTDVRMVRRCQRLHIALESLPGFGFGSAVAAGSTLIATTIQAGVGGLVCLARPTRPERRDDFRAGRGVCPESRTLAGNY